MTRHRTASARSTGPRSWPILLLFLSFLAFGIPGAAQGTPAPDQTGGAPPPATGAADRGGPPSARTNAVTIADPAELVVWNRPIVTLRAKIDNVTPAERVGRASQELAALRQEEPTGEAVAVPAQLGALQGYFIEIDNRQIFGLLPQDVDPLQRETLEQAAIAAAGRLNAALRVRAEQRSLPMILRSFGLASLATAVLVLMILGIVWLRRLTLRQLTALSRGNAITVAGIDLRPYSRATGTAVVKALGVAAQLVCVYLWLAFVLLQFSYTRPWGEGLGIWLISLLGEFSHAILSAVPGLFTVAIIFIMTRFVADLVKGFFKRVEAGWLRVHWLEAETARATRRLVIVLLWLFALTVAYPYIPGSQTDAFKGISVLAGLMLSLGAAGFINQVMSGFVVVYSRSVRTGEFVEVGAIQGTVTEVGMLATKLVTATREEVTIPNAVFVTSSLTNFSRHADAAHGSTIGTTVTIGYDAPWRQVQAMLIMSAERTRAIRRQPKPRVVQRNLDDFYVEYRLLFAIDHPETQLFVLSELHGHIQDVFNEHGVQILSPHFNSQPAEPVVVPEVDWHRPPAPPPVEQPETAPAKSPSIPPRD
ncbi:MAG: mechanosensitive ion channel [Geminicoccaceae bacterium]|jgi:small-conductance mechanosensitive channel|nr:mechanosensitive ion channel [Geminicoccaceae bacterium]